MAEKGRRENAGHDRCDHAEQISCAGSHGDQREHIQVPVNK